MADYLNIAGRIRTTASDGVSMEAQEVKDLNLNKSQQEVNADVQTELGDRYTKEETYTREELNELITTPDVNRVYVIATNLTTAVTDLLPATGSSDTLYNVGNWNGTQYDTTVYSIYGWDGMAYVCLAVRSSIGEVYDISANHPDGQGNPTPYADLAAALGTDGANIPADIRRGGMSIKFIQGSVQSSDNRYVQCRLMSDSWSINTEDWAVSNDTVLAESPEFVEVTTDADGKLIEGIKKDGTKLFESDSEFHGKLNINGEEFYTISNQEWLLLLLDSSDKIIFGVKNNGKFYAGNLDVVYMIKSNERALRYIEETIGIDNIDWGSLTIFEDIDNPEFISVELDNGGNVLSGRRKNGTKVENGTVEFGKVLLNGKDLEKELDKKADKEEDVNDNSVYQMNPDAHKAIVASTSAKYNYPVNPNKAMPSFLLMTDIHADWNCFERGLQYADDEEYINGVFVMGDICHRAYQLREYDYIGITNSCSKPVLSVEGNHEMIVGDSPLTQAELMELLYTNQAIVHNGDIHPTGKPWWYKDITHSYERSDYYNNIRETVTNTIRVIGLQQLCYNSATEKNEWYISQEELDWFIDVLDSVPQGAYIIILCHAMLEANNNLTVIDCKFSSDKGVFARQDVFTAPDFLTNIIRAWMNGGNITASTTSVKGNLPISVNHTFTAHPNRPVCFLSGHIHRDIVQRVNGVEPIYNVCLHCTSSQLTQQFGDLGRESKDGKKDKDCLTVFVLDYIYNRIKLIRIGADVTIDMTKRDFDTISLI